MDTETPAPPKAGPAPAPLPERKRSVMPAVAIILLLIGLALLSYLIIRPKRQTAPTPLVQISQTPTPTPRAIKQGKETYRISASAATGPQILEATIDPHDPKVGDTQTMAVKARSAKPITTIAVVLMSDKETTSHPLALASGSAADGVWEGSWTISDTVLYNYIATIQASDGVEETSIDITMR